jgi:hypothetical protein
MQLKPMTLQIAAAVIQGHVQQTERNHTKVETLKHTIMHKHGAQQCPRSLHILQPNSSSPDI